MTESLGACGSSTMWNEGAESELELGIHLLRFYLGSPPPGYRLHVQLHEHEFGTFGTIALSCTAHFDPAGWDYYRRCEELLSTIDDAMASMQSEVYRMDDEAEDAS